MSKTIGVRIDEKLKQKIISDGRPATEILRDALNKYFSIQPQKTDVNTTLTGVNKDISETEYQAIKKEIDAFLERRVARKWKQSYTIVNV